MPACMLHVAAVMARGTPSRLSPGTGFRHGRPAEVIHQGRSRREVRDTRTAFARFFRRGLLAVVMETPRGRALSRLHSRWVSRRIIAQACCGPPVLLSPTGCAGSAPFIPSGLPPRVCRAAAAVCATY
ncbi:hypothetical protein HPB50_004714 [Hyalomma asiaticum]|uniref:Uncharacterized protein n=1 Tax=Hyalomma asiaticum TaxID=266040 RepID=A0ACB7SVC8_HYAAI|nr:hypothetical protein HPB50_004714 [Hyalomma asiaticum]